MKISPVAVARASGSQPQRLWPAGLGCRENGLFDLAMIDPSR